jgi:hypothetical protein
VSVRRDPRVWLPALIGAVLLAPHALPRPLPAALPQAASVALPLVRGAPAVPGEQRFDLAADASTARFRVAGVRGELLVACPALHGTLRLDAGATTGELELRLDLASLQPLSAGGGVDVHRVLGVLRGAEVVYRGALVASESGDLPGLRRLTFVGSLVLGERVQQQPMQLWWCVLPGSTPRLQGHGTVRGDAFGLPARRWLGLFLERYDVTLGLDLAWRRQRGH